MSDNGVGGRRIGKKYFSGDNHAFSDDPNPSSKNIEEGTDYSTPLSHGRLSDWEQLIADYNRQNQFIRAQKRKWLPPKQRNKK